jgi:hypothetical protein
VKRADAHISTTRSAVVASGLYAPIEAGGAPGKRAVAIKFPHDNRFELPCIGSTFRQLLWVLSEVVPG